MKKWSKRKKIATAFSGVAVVAGASAAGAGTSILANRNPYEKLYFDEEQALERIESSKEVLKDWDREWEEGTVQHDYKQSWINDNNTPPDNPIETYRRGIVLRINLVSFTMYDSNGNFWSKEDQNSLGEFTRIKRVNADPNLLIPSWPVGNYGETDLLPGYEFKSFGMRYFDPNLSIIIENANGNDYAIGYDPDTKKEILDSALDSGNNYRVISGVLDAGWNFRPGDKYVDNYYATPHDWAASSFTLELVGKTT